MHGCQSAPNQSGGVVAYGTSMVKFAVQLAGMKDEWIERVESHRGAAA